MVGSEIIVILYAVLRLDRLLAVKFTPGRTPVVISADFTDVPYYAARSLSRTFITLGQLALEHVHH